MTIEFILKIALTLNKEQKMVDEKCQSFNIILDDAKVSGTFIRIVAEIT